jgi:hypothetical protein
MVLKGVMKAMTLSRCAVALVVNAVSWVLPGGISVSAETTADAIKMIDTDKDGTIELAEAKAAAAAVFLKLDTGHDGIIGAKDLAGRMVTPEQFSQGPNPWMFFLENEDQIHEGPVPGTCGNLVRGC